MSRTAIYVCGIVIVALMSFFFVTYGSKVLGMLLSGQGGAY